MPNDNTTSSSSNNTKPWKFNYLMAFLLADGLFIGLRQAIDPITPVEKFSSGLNAAIILTSFTAQYLIAFVIGMVFAVIVGIFIKEFGKNNRPKFWWRSLFFSSLPATLLLYAEYTAKNLTIS